MSAKMFGCVLLLITAHRSVRVSYRCRMYAMEHVVVVVAAAAAAAAVSASASASASAADDLVRVLFVLL
uniref:Secreted peptide n=1 Tax=Syphacia muris TaxID=451379 RepID=A0A0N5B1J6_9BILA